MASTASPPKSAWTVRRHAQAATADDMISNYPRRRRHGIARYAPYLNQRETRAAPTADGCTANCASSAASAAPAACAAGWSPCAEPTRR